jgi:hypothetical protein
MNLEEHKGLVKVIDIETSSLLEEMVDHTSFPYKLKPGAKLHVVVVRDAYTDEVFVGEGEEITKEWLRDSLKGCKYLVQHNGIKFDLIALKLFGILDYSIGYLDEPDTLFGEEVTIIDTLIYSRLFNPDRYGGHSLASWGERVGCAKMDFRGELIAEGIISKDSPKGAEFREFTPLMTHYCMLDTEVSKQVFFALMHEKSEYFGWDKAIKMENKLADLAIRRETFGFWFDKELAVKCIEDLTEKMSELQNKVNPKLPLKPMTKGELQSFTPPNTQFLKSGKPSTHIIKFAERVGGKIEEENGEFYLMFETSKNKLPFNYALKTHVEADISNLDHVKSTLIDVYNWIPTEWAVRDFTKDSKKQSLPYPKRVVAFDRWLKETEEGKYKKLRLQIAFEDFKVNNTEDLEEVVKERLHEDFPVRLPTSPKVRVGVEKDLCPNLIVLGEQVDFAKDFALFLTYKHRKSSIAGGPIEDMDFDEETPNSGFLSMYREEDGRVSTPAIEIGAATNRYRHIGICNIARASSLYGKEMRSLFGCGEGFIQLGFDYSSLENRVQGGYVMKYPQGKELAEMLLAEKPNDLHSVNAGKLGISRSDAKSFGYAILYGASAKKISNMLSVPLEKGKELYENFWEAVPALKQLRDNLSKHWESNDKKWIQGIDGRKIMVRSPHSLLNFLFQSGGVICAKYTTVFLMQELEKLGHQIDPFISQPTVCEMIAYHDEAQLAVKQGIIEFKTFDSKEEAEVFKNNWEGPGQLSTIKEGVKWYVALPSDVSLSIEKATQKTEDILKLQFKLSFEYDVHRNWYGCH